LALWIKRLQTGEFNIMKNFFKKIISQSFYVKPPFLGIDDLIVAGVISLIGTAVSSAVSSNSADKQVDATKEANAANMGLNLKELAISKENADTNKFSTQQDAQAKGLASFNSKLKNTDTGKNIFDIWSGK
jgi:hypothetical protein